MTKLKTVAIFVLVCFPLWTHALCVSVNKAVLRSGPGTQYKESWTVGKYTPLKYRAQQGSWLEVSDLDGKIHWVYSGSVTSSYSCVSIKVPYALLRQGPSESSPPAAFRIADKYFPFKKLRREDEWLEVEDDFGGQYWVKDTLLWWPISYANVSF